MAFNSIHLLKTLRRAACLRMNIVKYTSQVPLTNIRNDVTKQKFEDNLLQKDDPDTFGTLSKVVIPGKIPEDEGDIKEEQFQKERPLHTQKLTIKQYADLIKQYLEHKRLKEAIDVLEVRMLKDDRVKPENYIYNILIGACADVGYTKKAFKLFNDMKRRALKPTGDTYTCLFTACVNSPWLSDGLKRATHLRNFMIEKQIEPNITNFNSMVKSFGRCGDLKTAFKIVDEMIDKKIKIRVHTFNHLLQACISDRENGLRHALVVWRKMLKMREKPNIYSFNLMLKCVKDCNIGNMDDIQQLIGDVQGNMIESKAPLDPQLLLNSGPKSKTDTEQIDVAKIVEETNSTKNIETKYQQSIQLNINTSQEITGNSLVLSENNDKQPNEEVTLTFIDKLDIFKRETPPRLPNLLSKNLNLNGVLGLKDISTIQDKFAIIGGMDDFLNEMAVYSLKPDIKTFTQLLMVIDDSQDAENKLMERMKEEGFIADIDFYNMLIKKRCYRMDYDGALEVKNIIKAENKARKKKHFLKKKLQLKLNIMTYGVLAMACNTKEHAIALLDDMKENQLKVNAEIVGTLLKNAAIKYNFSYVNYIMNLAQAENVEINQAFVKHLKKFNNGCLAIIKEGDKGNREVTTKFRESYEHFYKKYKQWLNQVDLEQVVSPPHPWEQFKHEQPETVQNQNIVIEEPRRFIKRGRRRYVKYVPRL